MTRYQIGFECCACVSHLCVYLLFPSVRISCFPLCTTVLRVYLFYLCVCICFLFVCISCSHLCGTARSRGFRESVMLCAGFGLGFRFFRFLLLCMVSLVMYLVCTRCHVTYHVTYYVTYHVLLTLLHLERRGRLGVRG